MYGWAVGRRVLLVLTLAMLALACGTDDEKVRERDDGLAPHCDIDGATACRNDDACGDGEICSESCCLPACASAADCDASTCGPLGCVCDAGACRDAVCSADADCGADRVCAGGACVETPSAEAAAACTIAPRHAVIREGMELALEVKARDAAGRPLPISAGFTFASADVDRAVVDAAGIVRGGSAPGSTTIEASLGAATCEMEVWNHAAAPADALRVVVVDELTGLPIAGAQVQVETGAAPLGVETDAGGAATLPLDSVPAAPRTISVFHEDFDYLTIAGTAATDLLLPLRRVVTADRAGGVQGVFGPAELFHPDFVHAGVAGTSIPGNLIDLSFDILLGPSRLTRVTIGDARDVRIPSGVVLGLGNTWFKQEYQALGIPGVCDDRARMEAGTCGVRTAWGIAGGVPLLDLPIDEITEGGEDVEVGALLSQLLPHFQRFRSAVSRDVAFDLHPTVDGLPDWARFTRLDLQATQRMSLRSTVQLPVLPRIGDGWMDAAIVLGGAHVSDRGVVPLGITAGIDADEAAGGVPDGRIDDLEGRSEGRLPLKIAPLHGGLEGSDYVVLALATNVAGMGSGGVCDASDRTGCAAVSGLLDRSDRFTWDRTVDFGGAAFVAPAEEAAWAEASRTFTRGALPAGEPNVLRMKLSAGGGRGWQVWMPIETGELVLPVPGGMADRGAGARASVQALRLGVGLDELASFDETNLAELVGLLSSFSTLDLP